MPVEVRLVVEAAAGGDGAEGPAGKEVLSAAHGRALGRAQVAVFTSDLFTTGHDAANREAVRAVATADLDLAGIAVHGPRNVVDKIVKGASMHP